MSPQYQALRCTTVNSNNKLVHCTNQYILPPPRYNGQNIGRYLNQGGLREVLGLMVCLAQPGPFPFSLVEEAQQYFNARFSYNRHFGAVVLAAEDLVLHSSTQWSCSSIMESSPIGCMPHCTVGPAAPHGACCCLVCMLPGQAHGHNPFRKWSRTACHKGSTSHLPSSRPRTTTLQPNPPSTFCPSRIQQKYSYVPMVAVEKYISLCRECSSQKKTKH